MNEQPTADQEPIETPAKKKKNKAPLIIVLVFLLLIAGAAVFLFTFPGGPTALFRGKFPSKVENAFAKTNWTCEVVTDDYAVKHDLLTFSLDAKAASYSEDGNTINMSAFETYVKTYCVSESEVYYEFGVRHIATKDVLYKINVDKDYKYTLRETVANSYNGGVKEYKILTKYSDGKSILESLKGKKFAYDWLNYPKYDFVYIENMDNSSVQLEGYSDEMIYALKLNNDNTLNELMLQRSKGYYMRKDTASRYFYFTDYGTTVVPAI